MNSLALFRRFFTLQYDYKNPIEYRRAQLLLYILAFGVIIGGISTLQVTILPIISGVEADTTNYLLTLPFLTNLLMIYLIQTGRFAIASTLTISATFMIMTVVSLSMNVIETPLFVIYLLTPSLAVLLFERWQFNLIATANLLTLLITGIIQLGHLGALFQGYTGSAILIYLVTVSVLAISSGGLNELARTNQKALEKYDNIAQYATHMPMISENHVLGRMIDLVRQDVGYAFAQVFLVDQRGQITRRFRTGINLPEGGVFSDVRLGDASALVEAVRANVEILVSTQDSTVRWEHFLPATQYGLILPIQIGEQVIGVLDVQKTDSPFTNVEIQTLKHLIQHTATFTIYSRALDDFRSTVDNLRQSVSSLQSQLREYKQTEGDMIGATWMSYLNKRNRDTLGYDLQPEGILLAGDLPSDIAKAMQRGEIDIQIKGDVRVVSAPIQVRGEVLGALVFNMPKSRGFGTRQIDFIQSVTNRLALALENKRLFEESRSQATREQKANQVASMLIGATDVNDVLKIAVDSFNTALGAVATRIHVDRHALELETTSQDNPLLNDGDKIS